MANNLVFSLTALMALVPASVLPYRRQGQRRDLLFWSLLCAAVAGPVAFTVAELLDSWKSDLSVALWVSVASSVSVFALIAAVSREAWRLAPLLLPYLCLLALLAIVWGQAPSQAPPSSVPDAWLLLHIVVSVATYAFCTIAAVAGAAVLIEERSLKRKGAMRLTRLLPPLVDAESLQIRLLGAAEIVLGLGVVTGISVQYLKSGSLIALDHKTVLSLIAFAVIAALLLVHHRSGLRGQRAARLVLLAYLLLTLAYPGVKFVTDVLMGQA